LKMGDHNTK